MNVKYISSATGVEKCPKPTLPEYAFIGRSNVGKSSVINMLINRRDLARVSSKPGKTQLINHFLVDETWYLVDLPGYGYAKASKSSRNKWEKMITDYLLKRNSLVYTFILVDARHSIQDSDRKMINWFGGKELPFIILFTKTDKLNANELNKNLSDYKKVLGEDWEELPRMILTSAKEAKGRDELIAVISEANESFADVIGH